MQARDDGGLIPLHNACSFGHAEVVNLLLQHGADPNARDNWNYTPLHEAAIKGKIDVCIGKPVFIFQNFLEIVTILNLMCLVLSFYQAELRFKSVHDLIYLFFFSPALKPFFIACLFLKILKFYGK